MRIAAIIQARMNSERLPGKSLMKVGDKAVLEYIIENLKTSRYLAWIVLATTKREEDKALLQLAKKLRISAFAGSESNVLARYKDSAEAFGLDIVVRITGDNILTDVEGMDRTIALYLKEEPDLAINGGKHGYPLGTAVEVLSFKLLQRLNEIARSVDEREHVTLYIYKNQDKYCISYLKAPIDYRDLDVRLTIDTPEDMSLIRELYGKLKEHKEGFKLATIVEYLRKYPELKRINSHIKQKNVFLRSK